MIFILASFCFFILAVVLHLLWCRCQKKARIQSASYIAINLYFWVILIILFGQYSHLFDSGRAPNDLLRMRVPLTALILYFLAIPTYLIFYHSLFIESPSRVLLEYVKKHKKVTYEELLRFFEERKFIETRLTTLVETGVVKGREPFYRLLPSGYSVHGFYQFYQRLINKDKGG